MQNNTLENEIKLSPYYVAYMDILAAKNYINSDKSEEYLHKIYTIYNNVINKINNIYKTVYEVEIEYKIFSDNIIIAIKKEESDEIPYNFSKASLLIDIAACFQIEALVQSMLIRGSIGVGELCINNLFVYGKALTKAYELESELAIYPRIIINHDDVIEFQRSNNNFKQIHKDEANIHYINPFEVYFEIFYSEKKEVLKIIRNNLIAKINNDDNDKIKQKVCWLINRFNEFCQSNEDAKDEGIYIEHFPQITSYLNNEKIGSK